MDRCLPQFLLAQNPITHTNHFIIIGFFLLTVSLFYFAGGKNHDLSVLAGVYTVAFLSVMSLFGIGNILMKYKRKQLPRQAKAGWPTVILGIAFVVAGLIGNIIFDVKMLEYFALYFLATMLLIMLMFSRIRLLKLFLFFLGDISESIPLQYQWREKLLNWSKQKAKNIKNQPMAFFFKADNLNKMNKAIRYVLNNEITDNLKMVHVYDQEANIPPHLEEHIAMLDQTYPKIRIDLVLIRGQFTPLLVENFSKKMNIPKNLIFITCPSAQLAFKINEYGGIRVITH